MIHLIGICLALGMALSAYAQQPLHASGTFDVKLTPQGTEDKANGSTIGRSSAEKEYRGDLKGVGKGEMLSAITGVKNSAAYVAIERVTGVLKGKSGSFLLQHTGTMDRGKPQLSILVVPDSGAGELAGISGKMAINVAPDGKHSYEFEYTLPESR